MTSLEVEALKLALSNQSRVLYCLYLRPNVNISDATVTVNYQEVFNLINSKKNELQRGRQVNSLLRELNQVGLVEISENQTFEKSLNNQNISLPFTTIQSAIELPNNDQVATSMTINWKPDKEDFEQVAQLTGLIEKGFSTQELGEFIAFWFGYPEKKHTNYQWTVKFVLNIKQRRLRFPINRDQAKVGYQWVNLDADIEIDENVKKLVERYSGNK